MGPPRILADTVTSLTQEASPLLMASALRENAGAKQSLVDLESWTVRCQQADPEAPRALIVALSPALLRLFRSQTAIREQADDLSLETWMRLHRVRHSYRPGEPVLPWVYAIARRVGIDGYHRFSHRVTITMGAEYQLTSCIKLRLEFSIRNDLSLSRRRAQNSKKARRTNCLENRTFTRHQDSCAD
jgi:DNA-directed RNA polymerase specialized sigma24 family protein